MAERPPEIPADGAGPHEPPDTRHVNEDVRYEASQVSFVRVALVLLAIAATFAVAGLVSGWLVRANTNAISRSASDRNSYSRPSDELPPEPRLEFLGENANERPEDIFARQLQMERILRSYGKTSEDGFVRIPIEEAIRIAAGTVPAQKVLPEELARSFGLIGGGEPNSGRTFQEAPSWLRPAE
jgi:hypothetical protein